MFRALLFLFVFSNIAIAHEGHDHGSSQIQAPKGGVIRSLEEIHLELIIEEKIIKIYVYNTSLEADDVNKYPVKAKVILPRGKTEFIELESKGDHWQAKFDAKGAHRYTLEVSIKQSGHDDKISFTVEPKNE